ncbi:hemolysin family protein [Mycoplasmopsis columbinasalis]|uniref:Magnesium/cobalt efflux protein CorC n=1 Tax=Mycoplasmopsis columbinasalis TaxID=114880 RepID=A0A449BA65_9BACT|nr:hemolysin family protein [Mycoplasmopsis columbinasalis]VEU78084.1 magnesium/cobalt efflux protein CorC [Mycoplasmopsis columbinasalis]
MGLVILVILLVLLIIGSSIFSAAETAYTSLNPGKIETLVAKKKFGYKLIKAQHKYFNQTLATILICNNLVNIAASSLISYIFSAHVNVGDYNVLISTVVMTPILVIFGEIIPKIIAKYHPIWTAQTLCYPLVYFYYLFWIFTFPISKIGKKIYITNTEEDVKNLIDVAQNEGVLETNESKMAQNALDLDSVKVRRHFVKVKDVTFLDIDDNITHAQEVFKETNYSRLPVRNKDGNFLGIVLLKDIFYATRGSLSKHIKSAPTISANISLAKALEVLRRHKAQMAFVTDNNASADVIGIITIEDILEEIVGEIYDEHDEDEWKEISAISLELYHVLSNVPMKEILKELEVQMNISKKELSLPLKTFLENRTKKQISKSTEYSVDDVTFKPLKMVSKKPIVWTIEVSLGNKVENFDEIPDFTGF